MGGTDYILYSLEFQETVEVKRKVVKRSVKSEKELLEFTLKYQKVIAERDAGKDNFSL